MHFFTLQERHAWTPRLAPRSRACGQALAHRNGRALLRSRASGDDRLSFCGSRPGWWSPSSTSRPSMTSRVRRRVPSTPMLCRSQVVLKRCGHVTGLTGAGLVHLQCVLRHVFTVATMIVPSCWFPSSYAIKVLSEASLPRKYLHAPVRRAPIIPVRLMHPVLKDRRTASTILLPWNVIYASYASWYYYVINSYCHEFKLS